ncbi:hypothetical protein AX16_001150 [Volvariella volvacea WC 439]|nr:hypothetical protein AX16_001150 [Volvariella volvacea WC 439]
MAQNEEGHGFRFFPPPSQELGEPKTLQGPPFTQRNNFGEDSPDRQPKVSIFNFRKVMTQQSQKPAQPTHLSRKPLTIQKEPPKAFFNFAKLGNGVANHDGRQSQSPALTDIGRASEDSSLSPEPGIHLAGTAKMGAYMRSNLFSPPKSSPDPQLEARLKLTGRQTPAPRPSSVRFELQTGTPIPNSRVTELATPTHGIALGAHESEGEVGIVMAAMKERMKYRDDTDNLQRSVLEKESQVKSAHAQLEERNTELEKTQELLKSVQQEVQRVREDLNETKRAYNEAQSRSEEFSSKLMIVQGELEKTTESYRQEVSLREAECAQERKTSDEFKSLLHRVKQQIKDTNETYQHLRQKYDNLKESYESTVKIINGGNEGMTPGKCISNALADIRDVRQWVSERMNGEWLNRRSIYLWLTPATELGPIVDFTTGEWKDKQRIQSVTRALKEELDSAQRVIDMLRDKLYHMSTQLAEAQVKIRDLESEKSTLWGEMLRRERGSEADMKQERNTWDNIRQMVSGLIKKQEEELISALSRAATLDGELRIAKERIVELEALNTTLSSQHDDLKAEQEKSRNEHSKLTAKLDHLTTENIRLNEQLTRKSQELVNLVAERAKLEAEFGRLEGVHKDLNASFTESKKALSEASIRIATLTQSEEKAKKTLTEMERDVKRFKGLVTEKDESIHKLEIQNSERATQIEVTCATKLESVVSQYKTEIAILQEQKSTLQVSLRDLKEEAVSNRSALADAKVDFEKKLAMVQEENARMIAVESARADNTAVELTEARRNAANLQSELEKARDTLDGLNAQITTLETDLREAMDSRATLFTLEKRVQELHEQNNVLQERARTLKLRHKQGDLTPEEKEFAQMLMKMSFSAHERDVIEKDNELRRKENLILALQNRIKGLETTLAKQLVANEPERNTNAMSIVNTTMWMSPPRGSGSKV